MAHYQQITLHLTDEDYKRLQALRQAGYTHVSIFRRGLEETEKEAKKK